MNSTKAKIIRGTSVKAEILEKYKSIVKKNIDTNDNKFSCLIIELLFFDIGFNSKDIKFSFSIS